MEMNLAKVYELLQKYESKDLLKILQALELTSDTKLTIGTNLDVDGNIKSMENIIDSNDNKRFIEGEGTINTIEGITFLYNKWSLSGTHLMLVLALDITDGTTIGNAQDLISINLPNYILNKIVNLYGDAYVDLKTFVCRTGYSDTNTQNILISLRNIDNKLYVRNLSTFTATDDRKVRIQFDLLIDNE